MNDGDWMMLMLMKMMTSFGGMMAGSMAENWTSSWLCCYWDEFVVVGQNDAH